ncbi:MULTISPECIES: hypothetical protein [unclassified Burkholderia]|uniref:hypothetical protein n=1 Tax=unclassified Burkholderia TaxID=2613784 RepID=UPI002AB1465B|nr:MULTISPECIES: hypothetical protein [unclassified Burkholderia]
MESLHEDTTLQEAPSTGGHNKSTEDQYFKIVTRLYREAEARRSRDPELPATVSNLDVVNDLLEASPTLRPNTWRLYRAALRHHLEILLKTLPGDRHAGVQLALKALMRHQVAPNPNLPHRTSSNRRRNFSEDDLSMLVRHLNNRRISAHAWPLRAAHWLLAGLATGLRPAEWEHARLIDDRRLAVITGKRKGEPPASILSAEWDAILTAHVDLAEPLPQWIRIVEIEPSDLMWIKAHLSSIDELRSKGIPFADIYEQSRLALRRACEILWNGSKRISLYTARGQFASNSKAIKPLTEVSRLMGHRSTRTTQRNYGKRRYAHAAYKEAAAADPVQSASEQSAESAGEHDGSWASNWSSRVDGRLGGQGLGEQDLGSGEEGTGG